MNKVQDVTEKILMHKLTSFLCMVAVTLKKYFTADFLNTFSTFLKAVQNSRLKTKL